MRAIAALVAALVVIGCGTSTPTPIIVYVTPVPSPTASPTPTPAPPAATPVPATASPTPAEATVALPVLSAKVPGASKVKYYAVTGGSLSDVLTDLTSKCAATGWACFTTDYTINWQTRTLIATGYCSITSSSVTFTPTASLPRWTRTAPVFPEALAWWQQVLQNIASDESQAIKLQQSYDKKVASLMDGHRCSTANAIIDKWKTTVAAADAKLAAQQASWLPPVYTGPGGLNGTLP